MERNYRETLFRLFLLSVISSSLLRELEVISILETLRHTGLQWIFYFLTWKEAGWKQLKVAGLRGREDTGGRARRWC